MGIRTDIQDVFAGMMANSPSWKSIVPAGVNPLERIFVDATDQGIIELETPRPFALIDLAEYTSTKMTEGDDDYPISGSTILLEVQVNALSFTTSSHAANRREFSDWFDALIEFIERYPTNIGRYMRFTRTEIQRPIRTKIPAEEAEDDFWCAISGFQTAISEGGE